ncbi:MAG: Crp/Fnr family transcriptional regulator [Nitrospinales bacterium]
MRSPDILKQVSIFSSLEDKHLEEISTISQKKSFKKHEVIFTQGDPGDTLFVLISGAAKISLIGADGKETTLSILYANDFFGEMSLLDGHYRSATVTALEPVKALTISRNDFIRLIKKYPTIILEITISLCRRLRKTSEQVARLTFSDASGKVAHVLLELATSEGKRENASIVLNLRFGRQELANLTALSRETLTRVLYDLQARGYLKLEGKKVTILNESLLKEEIIQEM